MFAYLWSISEAGPHHQPPPPSFRTFVLLRRWEVAFDRVNERAACGFSSTTFRPRIAPTASPTNDPAILVLVSEIPETAERLEKVDVYAYLMLGKYGLKD